MSLKPKISTVPLRRSFFRPLKRFFLRQFPRRKAMVGGFLHRILGDGLFDHRLWKMERKPMAVGLALGLFIGLLPTYWVQVIIVVILAFLLKANLTASILGTAITNPFTTLPIVGLQYKIGLWLVGPTDPKKMEQYHGWLKIVMSHGKAYLVGSVLTAIIGAILGYFAVLIFWKASVKIKEVSSHSHH